VNISNTEKDLILCIIEKFLFGAKVVILMRLLAIFVIVLSRFVLLCFKHKLKVENFYTFCVMV